MKKTSLLFTLLILLYCSTDSVKAIVLPDSEGVLGQFNINSNATQFQKNLTATYGQGKLFSRFDPKEKDYCYFDSKNKNWLEISFIPLNTGELYLSGIFATNIPLCDKKHIPKINFKELKTHRNIKTTDSRNKVLKLYGKPQETIKTEKYETECRNKNDSFLCPQYGNEVLIYKGSTWSLSFHITNNRVISMLLSPLE